MAEKAASVLQEALRLPRVEGRDGRRRPSTGILGLPDAMSWPESHSEPGDCTLNYAP